MQEKYWKLLTQSKFALCYYDEHFARCVKLDRNLKIFCAVASSGAIAAWAACQGLDFVWGLVIAAAQVTAAINEVLPYKMRIKELSGITAALTPVYLEMEHDWLSVANGTLTVEEINELCLKYNQRWFSVENKFFADDSLPQNQQCISAASRKQQAYFRTVF